MDYNIAWWNLENLFDLQDSPPRPVWLQRMLARELEGWDQQILNRKIEQLAKVVKQMFGGAGPDLFGVCEVENKKVLEMLVAELSPLGRQYDIAHHDTSDQRGIDCAFIYDKTKFTAGQTFDHVVLKRNATRDLWQVNFTTQAGNTLIAIANHWPSRRGNPLGSAPYRIIAAETLSYWVERIIEIQGGEPAILVMGDFNDEPFNRSLMDYALSCQERSYVASRRKTNPYLWNLMWPLLGTSPASYYFDRPNMLDQFLASRGLARTDTLLHIVEDSVAIFSTPEMLKSGIKARAFGRPSKSLDLDGFSDHLPISCVIRER